MPQSTQQAVGHCAFVHFHCPFEGLESCVRMSEVGLTALSSGLLMLCGVVYGAVTRFRCRGTLLEMDLVLDINTDIYPINACPSVIVSSLTHNSLQHLLLCTRSEWQQLCDLHSHECGPRNGPLHRSASRPAVESLILHASNVAGRHILTSPVCSGMCSRRASTPSLSHTRFKEVELPLKNIMAG